MFLLSNRWLAWSLRLATEVVLVAWLLLLSWVVVIMVQQRSAEGSGVRQGSVYSELRLPPEIVEVSDPRISVFNFEASRFRIHYRTTQANGDGRMLPILRMVGALVLQWGIFALVLWQLRQILSTFVQQAPLTYENARRFRLISYLLMLDVALTAVARSLEYSRLAPLFSQLPARGAFDLFFGHIAWSRVFSALLILVLAEAVRLGAEHRLDSESVV